MRHLRGEIREGRERIRRVRRLLGGFVAFASVRPRDRAETAPSRVERREGAFARVRGGALGVGARRTRRLREMCVFVVHKKLGSVCVTRFATFRDSRRVARRGASARLERVRPRRRERRRDGFRRGAREHRARRLRGAQKLGRGARGRGRVPKNLALGARLRDRGPPPPDQAQHVRAQKRRGFLRRVAARFGARRRRADPLQLREERGDREVGRARASRRGERAASLEVRREHAVRRGEAPAVFRVGFRGAGTRRVVASRRGRA